ncbi:tubulin--tyrosine ligase-like protein 12 isoform X1 [Limulus polyphemus]|uniref:Tubulin--tyrosine ligase-like protein 12 isoform X1 n=1 Tax=Limulus polyphemus TaxID=6850 RepID=A0ABM1BP43_LIMPO|nr:tubulin--tyrosine ligase-like protein 12 isoform X1 [Limulus polyphemus]
MNIKMAGSERHVVDGINNLSTFLLTHQTQLELSGVPRHFWKTLYDKLCKGIMDAGETFSMIKLEYSDDESEEVNSNNSEEENKHDSDNSNTKNENTDRCHLPLWKVIVIRKEGVDPQDPQHIYLIDHAWTYSISVAHQHLAEIPGLLERMLAMMEIDTEEKSREEMITSVLSNMWRYNQSYSFGGTNIEAESASPLWYVMDEFGSRIQHSDNPNFRTVPFYDVPAQTSFTLLFPIKQVEYQGEVTRDYIEGLATDALSRKALRIPWEPCDMSDVNWNWYEQSENFLQSGRVKETTPDLTQDFPGIPTERKLKVYAEYSVIRENLHHPAFEIVHDENEADILWYNFHFKEYRDLSISSPHKMINQFPFEHILTVKDLLAITCRRAAPVNNTVDSNTLKTWPKWLPTTYNLKTEVPQFVSYYQQRAVRKLDNHWICKPWNLARSLDTHVTSDLNFILRLPSSGPKIACKYISNPVLFPRDEIGMVKFDFRYLILLQSAHPLRLYVYKHFWLRFANKPFSLDNFDDYEKHFTVMNYTNTTLKQMYCHDFIEQFEAYYPSFKWKDIEKDVFGILKSVMEAATSKPPPVGLCSNPQSRAMYAVDMMLEWDHSNPDKPHIQPMLLEVNWAPDCQRACQYYPEFFDDIFSVLFLNSIENRPVQLL